MRNIVAGLGKGLKKFGWKKWTMLGGILLLGGAAAFAWLRGRAGEEGEKAVRTAFVTRQNIVSSLSASGTISPKNSYNITSLVDGEVISADFEEGDQVTEGQVLYRIDSSSMDAKLSSANSSLERSRKNYEEAVTDYSKAAAKLSGNTYKSTAAGYIKSLKVKEGERISGNTALMELYDDSVMSVAIPFLSSDAQQISAGSSAKLLLSDTMEELTGTVAAVAALEQPLTGGQLVRNVTIEVKNPGGLSSAMTATAEINGLVSAGDGVFVPARDFTVTASDLSAAVTVTSLLVHEGDHVSVGTSLFSVSGEDARDILKSYQNAVDNAENSLESAQESLSTARDNLENCTITAPISGTVISKSSKAGDKVKNGSSASTLAVIYDLSSVAFQMNIDELDISNVKVGQSVDVTADAFSGEKYSGIVSNVSMEGSSSNGVTYYPVTVTIEEYGQLLPGMNVEGVIVLDSAENVLSIPVDALQRGDLVYVKDSSTAEKNASEKEDSEKESGGKSAPEGFHAVSVTTGIISEEYVEISSGELSEGEEVYVSQSTVSSSGTEEMGIFGMGGSGGGQSGPGGQGGPGAQGAPGGMSGGGMR